MEKRELKKVVEIILSDSHAIINWRGICDALDLTSALFEGVARERPKKDLLKSILEEWKSKNGENATKANLETAFKSEDFNSIADEIKRLNNSNPSVSAGGLKLPLTLNYEGVVANYVPRNEFEKEIIASLTDHKNRNESIDFPVVVLQGIGGVGKTTLARIICRLATNSNEIESELKYFEKNCIWIHAQNEEIIIKDFSKLLGIQEGQNSIIEHINEFYTDQLKYKPCLIIFDNVDDYEVVLPYLPLNLSTKVSLLITSNIEWNSEDLGDVKNIKVEYFTESEFSTFVSKIIPKISNKEIEYLAVYTWKIPYLANIACRGFVKWRKHHIKEEIMKYFQDDGEDIFKKNSGPSFTKYKLKPQDIVERQIKLMRKHEGTDGELAYELLCDLAFCKPDFQLKSLLEQKMESVDVAISILIENGFLKKNYQESERNEGRKSMSIHRSYQKAVRDILCQARNKEEQFEKILDMINEDEDDLFGFWNWSLIWETGLNLGDSIIEKITNSYGIIVWVTSRSQDNARTILVEYLKRTNSKKASIVQLFLRYRDIVEKDRNWDPEIDDNEFATLIDDLKSFKGKLRNHYLNQLVIRLAFKKQEWLEQIYESFKGDFKDGKEYSSVIFYAILAMQFETVEFFIAKGLNLNPRSKHGDTPLHDKIDMEIAKELLECGADPNLQENWYYQTLLHTAAFRGDLKRVKLLLSYKADPNIKNKDGKTTLVFCNGTA